uniref:EOG090X043H n=1 Tax=Evadne anonyx TaxID=141404 RepID=A0A9N6ZE00_9CRUS|nr:EOG090X043H [Evadne anonyx]
MRMENLMGNGRVMCYIVKKPLIEKLYSKTDNVNPLKGQVGFRMKPIMSSSNDTFYLCNFRVSVNGDWLCLKELHDLQTCEMSSIPARSHNFKEAYEHDPARVERTNLVNLCKLIVKELIESSVQYGRMLDSDFVPLQHFFIVLEHALHHGLRPKKGLLGPKKELWDLLQMIEKSNNEACGMTTSVRDLPTVKTNLGRARAWIRLALMQKKLADYLKVLIDLRETVLHEYYEPGSLLLSEDAVVLLGLLLGLNVVDCNLCLKEEDLDTQQGVIDFSLYLRSGSNNINDNIVTETDAANITTVLDQKNYVEELNRHLSATITNLQSRLDATTTSNTLMKEELALTQSALEKAQEELAASQFNLKKDGDKESQDMKGLKLSFNSDACSATEDAIAEVKLQLAEEKNRRLDLDKELELQSCMRAETEVALKLLEKDVHEKQDTIVSLRKQLEDIKIINLEMYRKLQVIFVRYFRHYYVYCSFLGRISQADNLLINAISKTSMKRCELTTCSFLLSIS